MFFYQKVPTTKHRKILTVNLSTALGLAGSTFVYYEPNDCK
jgi:hypothetical protein